MRTLFPFIGQICGRGALPAVVLAGWLLVPGLASAQVTNVVLAAALSGRLGIQDVDTSLQPTMSQATFKSAEFLAIVGLSAGADEVLGLGIDFGGGVTNLYLTIFNTATREQGTRVTTSESSVVFNDGVNFVFRMSAPVPARLPSFAGGLLEIAGRAQLSGGVPAKASAVLRGYLIDTRPFDTGGTTGVVLRATLKSGSPLRILPTAAQ